MRVNFILDMERSLIGSGVYSSATRLANQLNNLGILTDINGRNNYYDIYHFHTALPQSFLKAKLLSKQPRRKYQIIMTGHTTIEDFKDSFIFSNRIDFALIPYLKKFYSFADHLVAVSNYNRELLLRYGYKPDQMSIISNGIDLTKNRKNPYLGRIARKKLGLKENQLLVIVVGLCIYRKAPDVFTNVAMITPEHKFMWIGKYLPLGTIAHSSNLRNTFLSARKRINISFTGYVSRKTIEALWNAADIFLYVSREENQGIALLESIAYGIIPIVREHPVFDWLTHEKDCLKGKTVEEFSNNVKTIAKNGKLTRKLRENGKLALKAHDVNCTVKKLANLYSEIAK